MQNKRPEFREQLINAMVQAGFTKKHPAGWFKGKSTEMVLKEHALDQVRLADELDYDRATINHWLHGKKIPNINSLAKISEVLGVSTDYLLGLDENAEKPQIKTEESNEKAFFRGYIEAILMSTSYFNGVIGVIRPQLDHLNSLWNNRFRPIMETLYQQEKLENDDAKLFFEATCAFVHFWSFAGYHEDRLKYARKAVKLFDQLTIEDEIEDEFSRLRSLLKIDAIGYTLTEIQIDEAIQYLEQFVDKQVSGYDTPPIYFLAYMFLARAYRKKGELDQAHQVIESGERFIERSELRSVEQCGHDILVRYYEQLGDYYMAKSIQSSSIEDAEGYLKKACEIYERSFPEGVIKKYGFDDRVQDSILVRIIECNTKLIKWSKNQDEIRTYIKLIIQKYSELFDRNFSLKIVNVSWIYAQTTWIEFLDIAKEKEILPIVNVEIEMIDSTKKRADIASCITLLHEIINKKMVDLKLYPDLQFRINKIINIRRN